MEIDLSDRRQLLNIAIQVFHCLIALGFLIFGLVEFVSNPPYFDGYGDARASQKQLPENLFQNDPRVTNESNVLRLMDLPIFLMILAYFACCCWLRFRGLSWLLTASMLLNLLCFFVVNFWAEDMFSWKYYSSRNSGLELQVLSLTISVSAIFMVIFYTRRKMPFKLKSSLTVQQFGKVHLAWNFGVIFLVCFTCLLLWFSKLYISWACFKTQREIMKLCEKTNMVQCYFCEECNFHTFTECAAKDSYRSFHCESPRNSSRQKAFCIFNYNVGTYTFLTVFAYVGGLCIFLATFSQILIHYTIRFFLDFYSTLRKYYFRHCTRQMFVISDDIETLSEDEPGGYRSTELHHAATDDMYSTTSFEEFEEDGKDENDMGNILINASIG
ncbi:uncharacterized protein LOC114521626 [Dendronephthya gigantea]|uniref:uncharacterized protein LOC114521626 n=1 Tax=Dendronephthya gigantea TaxID=151771 RepID=UPI00106AAC15|nr:uncharacterized protein LOC114521626 [Dendronephthya gigantea]